MSILQEPQTAYEDETHRPSPDEIKTFGDDTVERAADRSVAHQKAEQVADYLRRALAATLAKIAERDSATLRRDEAVSPDEQ